MIARCAYRLTLPLLTALLLSACRDSPREVLSEASEAAAGGDLAEVRDRFSVVTVRRLEHHWRLKGVREADGWDELAAKLTFDGRPLEVSDETIFGDYAQVMAKAGVARRDYYLRKEDGRWRIELGAGRKFRRAAAEAAPESAAGSGASGPAP